MLRWILIGCVVVVTGVCGTLLVLKETSKMVAAPPPASRPAPSPPADTKPIGEGDPLALPEPPKLNDRSTLTALNKDKTLYLEKTEAGEMRVLLAAEVCLREGPLEVFLTKKDTKEHESVLRIDFDAKLLHAALLAAKAKPGKPVQFLDDKGEPAYKPASGQRMRIMVSHTRDNDTRTYDAREWIMDKTTKKPMAHEWVFTGSRFTKNPDAPDPEAEWYCANNGEVVCLSNFPDSMLDLPLQISDNNDDLNFEAATAKIPPLKSKVWLIFEPLPEKAKEKK